MPPRAVVVACCVLCSTEIVGRGSRNTLNLYAKGLGALLTALNSCFTASLSEKKQAQRPTTNQDDQTPLLSECHQHSNDLGVHPEAVVEEVDDVDSNALGIGPHIIGRHDDYTHLTKKRESS